MMELVCPHCQQSFHVSAESAGSTMACPNCNGSISIPIALASAPPPLPAGTQPGVLPHAPSPRGSASSGATCGILAIVVIALCVFALFAAGILAAIALPAFARAREAARRSSCQNNLKQMGLVFKMFANESPGEYYPALSPEPGRLMCANETDSLTMPVYPEYMTDGSILVCPSDPDTAANVTSADPGVFLDDESYFYLGYLITNDSEMEAFAGAYRQAIAEERGFDEDLPAPPGRGSAGGDSFYRLREGVERRLVKDIRSPATFTPKQAEFPILMDRSFLHHVPAGCNVLFMDGHVEFIRYPGKWPVTPRTMEILEELDRLGP